MDTNHSHHIVFTSAWKLLNHKKGLMEVEYPPALLLYVALALVDVVPALTAIISTFSMLP